LSFISLKIERNKHELVDKKGRRSLGARNGDLIVGITIFIKEILQWIEMILDHSNILNIE
jgi:hypothetical protein